MGNNCKTIVYVTTNVKNGKIYIGVHNTDNPEKFDGYIGDGIYIHRPASNLHPKTPFQRAVKKYGFDSFIRGTIKICDTREEALKIEAFIVDDNFINRDDTYNICPGGGAPPIWNERPVYQYDTKGNFIAEYTSVRSAEKAVGITCGITSAIKYKTLSKGYLWSDEKVEKLDVSQYLVVVQKKRLYAYNSEGVFVKEYPSISAFCQENKLTLGPVQRAIAGKTKARGFYVSLEKVDKFIKPKKERKPYTFKKDKDPKPVFEPSKRKIGQYTSDGELVKVYESVRECRQDFGNVSRVLSGKASHCKGFIFKYIDS